MLAPLTAIMDGVRTRNIDHILDAYADDARIANFAAMFRIPYAAYPVMKTVVTKEEVRALYAYEFANTQLMSVKYFDPKISLADGEATVAVQVRLVRVPLLPRTRREMYAAEAKFSLRLEAAGWRIVADRYAPHGYNVF